MHIIYIKKYVYIHQTSYAIIVGVVDCMEWGNPAIHHAQILQRFTLIRRLPKKVRICQYLHVCNEMVAPPAPIRQPKRFPIQVSCLLHECAP